MVDVGTIHAHPRNPRLVMRDDVVDSIATQLQEAGSFPEMHAPIVRPNADGYEMVSGHHRVEAARRAGLKKIPCWVRKMADEEAFMALVLSNAQGELKPLEIGVHALHAVPLEKGGRGKKGGLSAYAKRIGKSQPYVTQVRTGAEVLAAAKPIGQLMGLLDKAQHLAAIHAADRALWPVLVRHLVAKEWTVADTKHHVEHVAAFRVADRWAVWLPIGEVVERYLATREFAPSTVDKLQAKADEIVAWAETLASNEQHVAALEAWLVANRGAASWDLRQIVKWHEDRKASLAEASSHWLLGNWREHVAALADRSVSLVLTDPPYGMDYQSDYRLDRREDRKHERIANDGVADAAGEVAAAMSALGSKLADDAHVLCFCHWSNEQEIRNALASAGLKVRGSLVWVKNNTGMGDPSTTFAPKHERIIHAVKGSPVLYEREADVLCADRVPSDRHPTEKPVPLLRRLIEITTAGNQVVADPFGGVASTLVAAKESGRNYWGCEISSDYHRAGGARLGL